MVQFDKLNILIFEEYFLLSDALSKMLEILGMGRIYKATTRSDAQNTLYRGFKGSHISHFDFAIIDLAPPNNHGLDLLQWLRNHENKDLRYLPVILTTNDTREKVVLTGRDFGAHEILVKPYSAHNVSRRILTLINKPRPFIQSPDYKGPDRRRRAETFEGKDRRKLSINDIEIIDERLSA